VAEAGESRDHQDEAGGLKSHLGRNRGVQDRAGSFVLLMMTSHDDGVAVLLWVTTGIRSRMLDLFFAYCALCYE
jgi:hypothetical protein